MKKNDLIQLIQNLENFDKKIYNELILENNISYKLDIDIIQNWIYKCKSESNINNDLFGNIRDENILISIIEGLDIIIFDKELYSSFQIKSIYLLYKIIKYHPFSDGNKRLSAYIWFNYLLLNDYDVSKININLLELSILLISHSNAEDMDLIINIIYNKLFNE